jgi:hypothetical protein
MDLSLVRWILLLNHILKKQKRRIHIQWFTPVIPATWEAEIGKIMVQGWPRQKVHKTTSYQMSWVWWRAPVLSCAGGIGWSITVWGWPWVKSWDPNRKITKAKEDWSMAQMVECLLSIARSWVQTSILPKK